METFLYEVLKQVPALGVLVWLVHRFMSYQTARDNTFVTHLTSRDATMKDISDHCHKVQHETISAVRDNTRALGSLTEIIRTCNHRGSKPG